MRIRIPLFIILVVFFFLGIEYGQAPMVNGEKRPKGALVLSKKKRDMFLEKEYKKIPRIWDLRKKISLEVHHTPKEFLNIGKILSKIDNSLKREEVSLPDGIRFFEKCSLDHEMMFPTKVLCLSLLLKYKKEKNLKDYSKKIVKSARSVRQLLENPKRDSGLSRN